MSEPDGQTRTGDLLRLSIRYFRPHLRRQVEIFFYMLLGLAFTMTFPFVLRSLLDSAIPSHQYSQVVRLLVVLGVMLGISMLADLRRSYAAARVSASIVRQVRCEMFERLQLLSPRWFSRNRQGDVLARLFSDVSVVESSVSQTLRDGVFQILSLAASSIVLITLEPRLALVVIAAVPVVAIVHRLMAAGARRRSLAVQEELADVFGVAAENYAAQAVVKAFALERSEGERFGRTSDRLFGHQLRLQLFNGMFGLSVNLVVTTLRMAIIGLGAWMVMRGDITIGTLVAFTGVVGQALSPVAVLTGLGQQLQTATGSLVRINEVLGATPEVADAADATDLAPLTREIRLSAVGFSHTDERTTLDGINCVIGAGQRVAFVGPTGAGKSSLLQLLLRFQDVDEGAVTFDGVDVRDVTVGSLRAQVGVVFQDTFLFNTSIRDNIAVGKPDATDNEVEAAARAAELHDAIVAMPDGYDTVVGERGERLSGGQRQRLAIARALIRDPRVLLLDEATSALDPRTERMISSTLERVGAGRTTISVTHRLASITSFDRIFVLVEGRVVETGTHADLLSQGGVYAELWAQQHAPRPTTRSKRIRSMPPAHARQPVALAPTPFVRDLPPAWELDGATGAGVRVAVLDSGIEANHPDLDGCVDAEGGMAFDVDEHGRVAQRAGGHDDVAGHGTGCAGIIHALAPDATITSVQVLGADLLGDAATLLRGLEWAIEQRFDVINVSLGTAGRKSALPLHELCDRAYFDGTFIVTAANNLVWPTFPSMYASVTSVACNRVTDPFRFDHNPDPPTDFLAPGIDVDVAWLGGIRTRATGNSFAAAHVSGLAALVKSKYPDLRPYQLKTVLWATTANVQEARTAAHHTHNRRRQGAS